MQVDGLMDLRENDIWGLLGMTVLKNSGFYVSSTYRIEDAASISGILDLRPEIESKGPALMIYLQSHGFQFLASPSQGYTISTSEILESAMVLAIEWFVAPIQPMQPEDFVRLREALDHFPLPDDWALSAPAPTIFEFPETQILRKNTSSKKISTAILEALKGLCQDHNSWSLQASMETLQEILPILEETGGPVPQMVEDQDFIPDYECHIVSSTGVVILSLTDKQPLVH